MRLKGTEKAARKICFGFALVVFGLSSLHAGEISLVLRPSSSSQGPAIRLVFEGNVFEPPLALDRPGGHEATEGESFLRRVIATNRDGGEDDLLALWLPADREVMRPRIAGSPADVNRNRAIFRSMKVSHLRAQMAYGAYTLYFVEHVLADGQSFFNLYPTLRWQDQVFLTTRLESDMTVSALRLLAPDLDWTMR